MCFLAGCGVFCIEFSFVVIDVRKGVHYVLNDIGVKKVIPINLASLFYGGKQ